jgi:hypothetical protein
MRSLAIYVYLDLQVKLTTILNLKYCWKINAIENWSTGIIATQDQGRRQAEKNKQTKTKKQQHDTEI